jgi:hypothetical protein
MVKFFLRALTLMPGSGINIPDLFQPLSGLAFRPHFAPIKKVLYKTVYTRDLRNNFIFHKRRRCVISFLAAQSIDFDYIYIIA